MTKHIVFEVENLEVFDESPNSQFCTAKIQAFSSGRNRHQRNCSVDTLKDKSTTLYSKPILYTIDRLRDDFGSHSDPDKNLIAGFIVDDSATFEELPDGRIGCFVQAKLWKRYAAKAVEIFERDGGNKKVSVEMDVYAEEEREDGWIEMIDFAYTACTILGDAITEGSPGAHMTVSFSKEQEEYNLAYMLEFGKYDSVDFTIPSKVRKNAQLGLEMREKHGRGGNSVSLAVARYLSKNTKITPEKINRFKRYMPKTAHAEIDMENPDDSQITWLQWGGAQGYKWIGDVYNKITQIDNEQMKYFEEKEDEGRMEKDKEMEKPEAEAETPVVEESFEKEVEKPEEKSEEKETPEEESESKDSEKMEEKEEDEKEDEFEQMFNGEPILQIFEESDDEFVILKEEFAKADAERDFPKIVNAMYAKMCKMQKVSEDRMAENEELKEFKGKIEKSQKDFVVDSTIAELQEGTDIPEDKLKEIKANAENYSLEDIDAWKNTAKAIAFDYKKVAGKKPEKGEMKMSLPWLKNTGENKSIWETLKK